VIFWWVKGSVEFYTVRKNLTIHHSSFEKLGDDDDCAPAKRIRLLEDDDVVTKMQSNTLVVVSEYVPWSMKI